MLESCKVRKLEGSSNEGVLSFPQVIISDQAERRRREASRVYSNDYPIKAQPAEGLPGPSDDDDRKLEGHFSCFSYSRNFVIIPIS